MRGKLVESAAKAADRIEMLSRQAAAVDRAEHWLAVLKRMQPVPARESEPAP